MTNTPQGAADGEEHELRMSLLQHLDELRKRLVRAVLALTLATIISFFFAEAVLDFMRGPYCRVTSQPDQCELVLLRPRKA